MSLKKFRDKIRKLKNTPDLSALLFTMDFIDSIEESFRDFSVDIEDSNGAIVLKWVNPENEKLSITVDSYGFIRCKDSLGIINHTLEIESFDIKFGIPHLLMYIIKYYSEGTK